MIRRASIVVIVLAATTIASADSRISAEHFRKAQQAYSTGDFELALDEFHRAYDEYPAPEYLHNIAQAYRRLGRCAEAIDYFERFLAAKPNTPTREKVETQVRELRASCAVPVPVPAAPTPASVAPIMPTPVVVAHAPAAAPLEVRAPAPTPVRAPEWSVDAELGAALLGAGPVVMPPIARVRTVAKHAIGGAWHAGLGVAVARLPYDDTAMGSAWLAGPIVALDGSHPIAGTVSVVGEVAAGAQLAWGFAEGNPFTAGGHAAGTFAMPYVGAAVGVAWRARDGVTLRALPFAYEATFGRAPLAGDIGALRGFAMLVGAAVDL